MLYALPGRHLDDEVRSAEHLLVTQGTVPLFRTDAPRKPLRKEITRFTRGQS